MGLGSADDVTTLAAIFSDNDNTSDSEGNLVFDEFANFRCHRNQPSSAFMTAFGSHSTKQDH